MHTIDDVDDYVRFRDTLVARGLLLPGGVRGVFGRSRVFEDVVRGIQACASRTARPLSPEVVHFPPVLARAHYCCVNHVHNFPNLMGSVHSFGGGDREHAELLRRFEAGEDWTRDLEPTGVMMMPAACYPLYPAASGTLPDGGRLVELSGWVFRHEPSDDPSRMQIFRQHEFVRLGSAAQAVDHRDAWLRRSEELLRSLGLPVETVVADDPFFGRGGRLAKATQREQVLKFELVVPICSDERPTAIASANCHLDYFGRAFDVRTADGRPAHTACVGFGLERIALALFHRHGLDTTAWPAEVRERLSLD